MEVLVATALAFAGLLVVVLALQGDTEVDLPAPEPPDWDPLPSRAELARADFPLRVPGYDPATVDLAFDALADAYADLLAEADPATITRARRRVEARLHATGRVGASSPRRPVATVLGDLADEAPWDRPEGDARGGHPDGEAATRDALRAEVALDAVRRQQEA